MDDDPEVRLVRWDGPWSDDDPDANLKADIALYSKVDPLATVANLAAAVDVPVGAVVRYVLARWATAGSEGLLAAGPSVINRMWDACAEAEEAGTDEARLAAYARLRDMVAWMRLPLEGEAGYGP
ncbi:MAG: DUF6027 family protein [Acidimicrobiales bacterium]